MRRSNPTVLSYSGRPAGRFELPLGGEGGASVGRLPEWTHDVFMCRLAATNLHPDETARDLFFLINGLWNSGEADMPDRLCH